MKLKLADSRKSYRSTEIKSNERLSNEKATEAPKLNPMRLHIFSLKSYRLF